MIELWITDYTHLNTKAIITALNLKEIIFSVDRSFFPKRSNLISAYIIITTKNHKIGTANFILSVALPYHSAYSAELCGTLAIHIIMEYLILSFYNQIRKPTKIKIASDCSSVLRFIITSPKIASIATLLHPIRREILRIKSTYQIGI